MLKGTHLPIEIKEIQAGYLHSPYIKEIYQYLSQKKTSTLQTGNKEIRSFMREIHSVRLSVV